MQAAATAPAWCPAHHQHHREPPRVGLRGRPGGRPRAMPRRPSSAPPGPYGMALLLTTWQWLARQAQAPCTHALAANITSPHQPAYPVHASGSVLVSRPGSDLMSGEAPVGPSGSGSNADACPRQVKDAVLRAADRRRVPVTLVANSAMSIPRSALISPVQVRGGPDEADHRILEDAQPGCA